MGNEEVISRGYSLRGNRQTFSLSGWPFR